MPSEFTYELREEEETYVEKLRRDRVRLISKDDSYIRIFEAGDPTKERDRRMMTSLELCRKQNLEEEGKLAELIEHTAEDLHNEFEDYFDAKFDEGFKSYEEIIWSIEDK